MNISDNEKITDFLQEYGCQPTSIRGNNWWYLSPLRDEHTASFKVDVSKNVWYDFGLGKGGNLRTLVRLLFHDTPIRFKVPSFLLRL
jgi:DNA primase (bacterial type)